jgi:hypothetical protein
MLVAQGEGHEIVSCFEIVLKWPRSTRPGIVFAYALSRNGVLSDRKVLE